MTSRAISPSWSPCSTEHEDDLLAVLLADDVMRCWRRASPCSNGMDKSQTDRRAMSVLARAKQQ
jgi:hypothetical protein